MKKTVIKDIKELIEFLLKIRARELAENEDNSYLINSYSQYPENSYDLKEKNDNTNERFDERLITLNNLLKKEEQNKEVLDIEQQIRKIQSKKNITTKEFSEIYNISISSQKDYRGRLNDPLPFHQKVRRGTIVYSVDEVEKWLQNQYK